MPYVHPAKSFVTSRHVTVRVAALVALSAPFAVACGDSKSTSSGTTTSPDGGVTTQPTGTPAAGPVDVPFLVSEEFSASGYMGDSEAARNSIAMSTTGSDCLLPRASGAAGTCYTVGWTPVLSGDPGISWAGVYWQGPTDNWGGKPGKDVVAGATKVSFYAAGRTGGEEIQFKVGDVNTKMDDPTLTYKDSFGVSKTFTLTTTWTRYEIPLEGAQYTQVIGAFAWIATTTSRAGISFYLDDIRWEK